MIGILSVILPSFMELRFKRQPKIVWYPLENFMSRSLAESVSIFLMLTNPDYEPIKVTEEDEFMIWSIVISMSLDFP